jgi:tetratricopeptide (TPR) repeat protein
MAIWFAEIKELEKLYESIKGQLPDLDKELERLIKADDENMILLYSRRCLEVIITDLCECELKRPRKTEPLQGIIDKLHKEEKIPSHIIASMHGLNELSTYGAHPKDFDPKQVRTTLINLETIIEWYLKYKVIDIKGEEEIHFRGESLEEVKKEARIEGQEKPIKSTKQKLLSGVLITAILAIAAILAYPKIFNKKSLENLQSSDGRISVAVMPFQNMTNDSTWNVWQEGIQDILVTYLSNSPEELKVRQTESVNDLILSKGLSNYASITPTLASNVSQMLAANVFIYGSIKQAGPTLRINAQLIDSRTEETIKSFELDAPDKEDMIFKVIDSLKLVIKNFLLISKLEKEMPVGYKNFGSTDSPEAFKYYIYGQKALYKKDYPEAIKLFKQSIALDSTFFPAYWSLGTTYGNSGMLEEVTKLVLKFYDKRDQWDIQFKIKLNQAYAFCFETPFEEVKYFKQLEELDDQLPSNNYNMGEAYTRIHQYDKAIPEFEKALEIYKKWGRKPLWAYNYTLTGLAFHETGQYMKEKKLYKKAEQDFPDDPDLLYRQAVLSFTEGDTVDAFGYIEKLGSALKENSVSEAGIITYIAMIYNEAKFPDKAEDYYRQALVMDPENPTRINNLAWFLIDQDRNILEGLELTEKALKLMPYDHIFLHTKGWGLYKLGRFGEANDILQQSWDIRRIKEGYDHSAYLHLEAAKKAVAGQKNK